MSDKVKLTKAQDTIIKSLIAEGQSSIIHTMLSNCADPYRWSATALLPLKGMSIHDLITAFYRPEDIIVEQTVEEQLIDFHGSFTKTVTARDYVTGQMVGDVIANVLDIIGMKVKGINEFDF